MAGNGHGDVLTRALDACVKGDTSPLPELFTKDVSGWSPNMLVSSLGELTEAVGARDESLSDVSILVHGVDVVGNRAYAEYVLSGVFSGPFPIGDEVIEPNGQEVVFTLRAAKTIRGLVVMPDGKAPPMPLSVSAWRGTDLVTTASVAADGAFELLVAADEPEPVAAG